MTSKFREYGGTTYAPKHNYIKSQILSLNKAHINSIIADTIETDTAKVSIKLTTPCINTVSDGNDWRIDSDGHIYCTGMSTMSDYRIKTNVSHNLTYSIDNIKPVSYHNKLTKKDECGVLAHELQEIYPNLVSGIKDDAIQYQTVNYTSLVAILIKEVQDLKKNNAQLKEQMLSMHESILEMA